MSYPNVTNNPEALGDAMKALEKREESYLLAGIPTIVRLDGRAFHTFTRGMKRPFDPAMTEGMVTVTKELVAGFHALVGYTQSDEITLVLDKPEALFSGRVQKLASVLAGYASARFAQLALVNHFAGAEGWTNQVPCFDARVFQVPNWETALDALIWREDDATKNSVSALARAHFSHKELQGKGRKEMLDMLHAKNIVWAHMPTHFKRGVYVKNRVVTRTLTEEERARIPEEHRPPAEQTFERGETVVLDLPPLRSMDRFLAGAELFRIDIEGLQ